MSVFNLTGLVTRDECQLMHDMQKAQTYAEQKRTERTPRFQRDRQAIQEMRPQRTCHTATATASHHTKAVGRWSLHVSAFLRVPRGHNEWATRMSLI